MASMDKFAPRSSGVRDPRDTKKNNGLFHNVVRFLKFGGVRGSGTAQDQSGSKGPSMRAEQTSVGPISDRGKGRS